MRYRLPVALLALCLGARAQGVGSVDALVSAVRQELGAQHTDSQVARAVSRLKLTERLDDRTIETLQSEGAGPETVAQLLAWRDRTVTLARPAHPAIPEPPPPVPAAQVQLWNAARDNAVAYTESLPDFICSEVVRRFHDPQHKEKWRLADTLVLKLTFFGHEEDYKLVSINNHPTSMTYEQLGGTITQGEFGSMLAAIFSLKSRANRDWDHWTTLRSRPTHVYTFSIAAANSQYRIATNSYRQMTIAQRGYLYIDDATKMVVRLFAEAVDLPPGFPVRKVTLQLDYDFQDVGGVRYLLPLHSETLLDADRDHDRNEADFLLYRKFSSDATITYK